MEAYCVKCKEKRPVANPQPVFTKNGAPATEGTCPVCGGKLFRMGRTPAHEGLTPPPKPQPKRKGKLVIVESPAKARTIERYLGKGYTVKASLGHVRDLLRSQLAVDVENDFRPKYRVPNEKRPVVQEIKKLAQQAEEVYLATDPDREGEAIAWHLLEAAEIELERVKRVVFHEITKPAIQEAFQHPRHIDMNLVNAQQARRILDRLVGYSLSPLLWRKVRSRLSAGRVQSVALRLIVEREREIEQFTPEEYWTINVVLRPEASQETYTARLVQIDGQEPELKSEAQVQPIVADMQQATYMVQRIKRGQRQRKPQPPFITSTLQQEASRKLGFTAQRTMAVAQQLYEGVDLGQGERVGLITYMRTDSTQVSQLAQQEARQFIQQQHGEAFLPERPPQYKTRAQRAQEAHEAIRPTSVFRTPEQVKPFLTRDQFRLYQLIWQRFVASQMKPAVYDTLSVEIEGQGPQHRYWLRASGSTLRFVGYLVVYEEAEEDDSASDNLEQNARIPASLREGQKQVLVQVEPQQHFTQPPPRYTDATLVRALEELGIGRPSTYAPTLSTLQQRGYVRREGRRLIPTETGKLVNDLLVEHFPNIVDVHFTAHMEEDLDQIAAGKRSWVDVVRSFYTPFAQQVEQALQKMPEHKQGPEPIGRACPQCGGDLVVRWGRFGKFISCSNFPECRYTEPWLEKIGVSCPVCGGDLVVRRSRRGRTFYGCANYPQCTFTSWQQPLPILCPSCGGLLVQARRNQARCLQCEQTFSQEELPATAETAKEGE